MKATCAAIAAAFVIGFAWATTSSAQSNFGPFAVDTTGTAPRSGWIFTPALLYSTVWDDNALLRATVDQPEGDLLNILNPSAAVEYNSKRTQFDVNYDGAFLVYRQFDTLDSYDQHGSLSARHYITPHVVLFVRDSLAVSPTTEAVQLVGVPFVRTGMDVEDLHGGVEVAFTKRLSLTASYDFQWVKFDSTPFFPDLLEGGHSHGATALGRYRLSARTTLTGTYSQQHGTVADGLQTFVIQQIMGGLEQRLSDALVVFGEAGISRLGVSTLGEPQTGPAFNIGFARQIRKAGAGVTYSRSFVPSYSFGGTSQNQEIVGHVNVPLGRRLYAASSVAWRSNQPLTFIGGNLNLHSTWYEGHLGYAFRPWVRLEAFYGGERQSIDRPGGLLDHNRLGFQVITSTPMRLR